MGELALRKIQAGVEAVSGTAVAATRKVYGTLEPKRDQPRRYAMEERGVLVSNFRANARLVDAEFKLKGDVLFEDFPFYLETMNKGGVNPSGSAATGYTYDYTPAIDAATLASNPLKSLTMEWGDESLAWQAPFSQSDTMKIELGTDSPILMEIDGFVQEWWPTGRNSFTGFTNGVNDHAVESPNGWQIRLFIDRFDPFDGSHDPIGKTHILTRYIKATAEYKNQNKRKYFGDFAPFYQKIGRGRRDIQLSLTLEEQSAAEYAISLAEIGDQLDTNQPNFRVPQARVRLQAVGSQITGTTFGVMQEMDINKTKLTDLAGALTIVGGPYVAIPVDAVAFEAPTGGSLVIGPDTVVLSAPAHVGDVSLAVNSYTPTVIQADETAVYAVAPYTWVSVSAGLTHDVPGGAALVLGDKGQIVTALASTEVDGDIAETGDKTIPIQGFTPRATVPAASNIFRAKSIEFDFYGSLDGNIKWAAHETNVAYDLTLKGVYDTDATRQDAIFVTNGNATVTS